MKKSAKFAKIISIMLCLMMVLSLFPATALADPPTDIQTEEGQDQSGGTQDSTGGTQDSTGGTQDSTGGSQDSTGGAQDSTGGSQDLTGEGQSDGGSEEDVTITHLVLFIANDAEFSRADVKDGDKVSAPSDPTPPKPEDGTVLEFLGWYEQGASSSYDFETPVYKDLDLFAKFGEKPAEDKITTDGIDTMGGRQSVAAAAPSGGIEEDGIFWTFHFIVYGAETTQTLKNGETLVEPTAPTPNAGERFVGWYEGGAPFTGFGMKEFTEAGDTTITAVFETTDYQANFHDYYTNAVVEVRKPGSDNMVSTLGVSEFALPNRYKLVGWTLTKGSSVKVGDFVEVSGGNVDLYPVIDDGNVMIAFNSDGGTYVPPMVVPMGTIVDQDDLNAYVTRVTGLNRITKPGYTFVLWLHFPDGKINQSVTLTAIWTYVGYDYTVAYWQQNLNDDNYTLVDTRSAKADLGATIRATSDDKNKYTGFTFSETKSDGSVTVAEDGSAQLNLYFNRKTCTLVFKTPAIVTPIIGDKYYEYIFKSPVTLTGSPHTGRYGAEIGYWPSSTEYTTLSGYVFIGWYTELNPLIGGDEVGRLERYENTNDVTFGNGTVTLYARFESIGNSERSYTVNFFLANAAGAWSGTPSSTRSYEYKKNDNCDYTFSNDFSGYTLDHYNAGSGDVTVHAGDTLRINPKKQNAIGTVNVYYTRASYQLIVMNGSVQQSSTAVQYLSALSGYQPAATPEKPAGVGESAVWAGWYTTQSGQTGTEMVWSNTMPAHDLTVYGVWKTPSVLYTAIAHSKPYGMTGGTVSLGNVPEGGTVSLNALNSAQSTAASTYKPSGATFDGWMQLKNGALVRFNQTAPVYGNLELYPHWVSSARYTVTYALNGAGGTAPTDGTSYAVDTAAQVLSLGSGVTPPVGQVFVGWKSDLDGIVYYPGGSVIVTGNLTLTAQWADEAPKVHITYYGNGGSVGGVTAVDGDSVPNNTFYQLVDVGFTRTGYTFDGWYTNASGTGGSSYAVGYSVRLGSSGTITGLYAKWKPNTFAVTLSLTPSGSATTTFVNKSFDYHSDVTMSWTPASGYQTLKVTDNRSDVAVSGNSYTINDIEEAHNVVVTLVQIKHTLSFGRNDGIVYQTEDVAEGAQFQFPTTVSGTIPAGQSFAGWAIAPNQNSLSAVVGLPGEYGTMQTQNLTYYAVLVPIVYHVSIAAEVDGTLTAFSGNGDYLYHNDAALNWTPTTGYETVKVTDNGTEVTFSGNSYTIPAVEMDHNIVVTLEPADYSLIYVKEYGSTEQIVKPVEWNQSYTIDENTFKNAGHYFIGWTSIAGGTTPEAAYAPGTNFAHMPANDITLYAVWADQINITLTSRGATVNYDTRDHTVFGFTSTLGGLRFEGISASASGNKPGEYVAAFTGKDNLVIRSASDRKDVTEQYNVTWVEQSLVINPIVVYKNSVNNGTYFAEYVAYGTGDASYSVPPQRNLTDRFGNVYYWDGTYDIAPGDPDSTDVKTNLTITANYTLTKTLTITAKSPTVDYTGAKQTVNEAEPFDAGLQVSGYRVYGEGRNVGEYPVRVFLDHVVIRNSAGDDITYQYTVVPVNGTLTIKPIDMAVSVTGYSGQYDNKEHRIGVTPAVRFGTTIAYSYSAHNNPASYELTENPASRNVSDSRTVYFVVTNPNYNPYFGSAVITITPVPIELTAQDRNWVYDGVEHTWQFYTITSGTFLNNQGIASAAFSSESKITNVGSKDNIISSVRLKTNTRPENYDITLLGGTLLVTPSNALRVSVSPVFVPYDGKEHSLNIRTNVTAGTEFYYSFKNSTNLSDYTKGEYKGIDVSDSKFIYVAAVNPNYNPAFASAMLSITRRNITLTSDTASKVYDGTELMAPNVTQSGDFVSGEGFETTPYATTSIIDTGSTSNLFTRPALTPLTDSNNYVFNNVYGTLTIEQRKVLLVADDATKNYGDPDPAYTFHTFSGVFEGIMYYDVLPGDLGAMNVTVYRGDASLPSGELPGKHSTIVPTLGPGSILFSRNYGSNPAVGTLTINPQISYLTGTTDVVTGMPATQWTPYDTTATLSTGATAVRVGYKLTGWLDAASGTTYALGATIPNQQKNLILTAQWTPNLNSVSFLTGTGAAVANMPANIPTVAYLATVTLPTAVPTRVGFVFDGWQTSDVDDVARVYAAGATFVMPNNGVTLTAAWAANLYTVTYISNYTGGGSYVDGTHATLSTVTVAGNNFVRRGYRFLGWSSTATGAVTNQPGGTFVMPAEPVRFYAQWQQLEYRVDYYVTGGTTAGLDGNTPYATYTGLHYGDAMPRPNDPTLDGYTFSGWTGLPATVPEGGLRVNGSLVLQSQVAPLTERIDDQTTPLAGKSGIPLWLILVGAGLLGLGLLWLLLLLAKRRKEEEQQQGAK